MSKVLIKNQIPVTENLLSYLLVNDVMSDADAIYVHLQRTESSQMNGITISFDFVPEVDILEFTKDGLVFGYELKGQRKWGIDPCPYEGLDQALFYSVLPHITAVGKGYRTGGMHRPRSHVIRTTPRFGGSINKIFLVHSTNFPKINDRFLSVFKQTHIGLIYYDVNTGKIVRILSAKPNPLFDEKAQSLLFDRKDLLHNYSVPKGRVFKAIEKEVYHFCSRHKTQNTGSQRIGTV